MTCTPPFPPFSFTKKALRYAHRVQFEEKGALGVVHPPLRVLPLRALGSRYLRSYLTMSVNVLLSTATD